MLNFLKSHRSLLVSLLIISTFQLLSGCKWFRKHRPDPGHQQDSGTTFDAGTQADSSVPDGGHTDASTPDTGNNDAGTPDATLPDGGSADSSIPGDAQVPTNTAPVAQPEGFSVSQYQTLTVSASQGLLANDSDADGDTLSAELVSGPAVGAVDVYSNGSFDFSDNGEAVVSAGNPNADVTFTYRAFDGVDYSAETTVTVTVTYVPNTPPVAQDDSAGTDEDTLLSVAAASGVGANDSDANPGDSLSFALTTGPSKGLVTLAADGSFTFDPNNEFHSLAAGTSESVSFVYTATDTAGATDQATVTVDVTGLNDIPVAQNDVFATNEDSSVVLDALSGVGANDSDADLGATLTFAAVGPPSKGTLSLNPDGSFSFDPDGDFESLKLGTSDTATFTYSTTDDQGASVQATAAIQVDGLNDAPTALDDAVTANEDSPVTFDAASGLGANDTDPDLGDTLTFSLHTQPTKGLVAVSADGSFTFDPNAEFDPLDAGDMESMSFIYTVTDSEGASDQGTVTVQVAGLNDATAVQPVAASTPGHTLLSTNSAPLLAAASDVDNDAVLTVVAGSLTTAGGASVTITAAGNFNYRPAIGAVATTDSFDFTISDEQNVTTTATATITLGDEVIWYIDNSVGSSGDGRSDAPFATITEAEAASAPGDVFYVHTGSAAYAGVTLTDAQRFIGAGAPLATTIAGAPVAVLPAGQAPILNSSGVGVTLASGNQVSGIELSTSGDSAISGTGITDALISQIIIDQPAARGLHLDGVGGSIELTSITIENTATEGVLVENSSANVTVQDLDIAGVFTTDAGNDIGLPPEQAVGSAVRLLSNTGAFSWDGGSLHCGDGRVPGLYAATVGAVSLSGTANAPLEISHCGTAVASSQPVTGIYVTSATSFNGQYLALHDLAPGISLSDTTALGAVHLIDVADSVAFENSTIGVSEASWGITAAPPWGITRGHGLYIDNKAATSVLDVAFNDNLCEGPAGSVINLRDCLHMDFTGDDNASVNFTGNDNVGNYVYRMYQILLRGTAGASARNSFEIDNNTVNGIQKDGIKFRVYDSPEAVLDFTNNHFGGESAAAVENGILIKQYGTGGTPELDITIANTTIDTFEQGAVTVELKKVGAGARVLVDDVTTADISNSFFTKAPLRLYAADASTIDATLTNNTHVNPGLAASSIYLSTSGTSHICLDARDNVTDPVGLIRVLWFDNLNQSSTTGISVSQASNSELASDNDDINLTFNAGLLLNFNALCLAPN